MAAGVEAAGEVAVVAPVEAAGVEVVAAAVGVAGEPAAAEVEPGAAGACHPNHRRWSTRFQRTGKQSPGGRTISWFPRDVWVSVWDKTSNSGRRRAGSASWPNPLWGRRFGRRCGRSLSLEMIE